VRLVFFLLCGRKTTNLYCRIEKLTTVRVQEFIPIHDECIKESTTSEEVDIETVAITNLIEHRERSGLYMKVSRLNVD
jgi:hypothetical protein